MSHVCQKQISVFLFCETVALYAQSFLLINCWVARPQLSGWHPTVQAILQHLVVVEPPPWRFGWWSKVVRLKHPWKREVMVFDHQNKEICSNMCFFLAKNIQILLYTSNIWKTNQHETTWFRGYCTLDIQIMNSTEN